MGKGMWIGMEMGMGMDIGHTLGQLMHLIIGHVSTSGNTLNEFFIESLCENIESLLAVLIHVIPRRMNISTRRRNRLNRETNLVTTFFTSN